LNFTPWGFGRVALSLAASDPVPAGMLWPPLISTIILSAVFIVVGLVNFEKSEF
jgi:hypothetical protein